ncbi:unnamed protein product [Sphagnum balticum]
MRRGRTLVVACGQLRHVARSAIRERLLQFADFATCKVQVTHHCYNYVPDTSFASMQLRCWVMQDRTGAAAQRGLSRRCHFAEQKLPSGVGNRALE